MAAEDLILHKRLAGRHKDLAAVEEIFDLNRDTGALDGEYLRRWAAHYLMKPRPAAVDSGRLRRSGVVSSSCGGLEDACAPEMFGAVR